MKNNIYLLFLWPQSQFLIGNKDAFLVLPPEDDTCGAFDSAYLADEKTVSEALREAEAEGLDIDGILPEGRYQLTEPDPEDSEATYTGKNFLFDHEGRMYYPLFDNTPDWLRRFLKTVPNESPLATDRTVTVVVEDTDGKMVPLQNAWYDELTGAVRLSVDEILSETDLETQLEDIARRAAEWLERLMDSLETDELYTSDLCKRGSAPVIARRATADDNLRAFTLDKVYRKKDCLFFRGSNSAGNVVVESLGRCRTIGIEELVNVIKWMQKAIAETKNP